MSPDGSVRTASPNAWASDLTLGPDGQAWFVAGAGIVRVDAAGNASPIAVDGISQTIATGADGTASAPSSRQEQRFLRIAPDGTVTESRSPSGLPGVPGTTARASE